MPERVLDTVVLRVLAFAHPRGVDILLSALDAPSARFPAEAYNADEDALPLDERDEDLSELARGLRFAHRQTRDRPAAEAVRYQTWLEYARQLAEHLEHRTSNRPARRNRHLRLVPPSSPGRRPTVVEEPDMASEALLDRRSSAAPWSSIP